MSDPTGDPTRDPTGDAAGAAAGGAAEQPPPFTQLTDLASRALGAGVVAANDELFAPRENLLNPWEPAFDPHTFGPKGKVYDGWETRRRREPGHDWAVVRLGAPGVVRGVVVDTAWFRGNFPPSVSVEATAVEGYPPVDELLAAPWTTLVERTACLGDTRNAYPVRDERCWTHVRLSIHPDGGVARLRVHGEVVADPRFLVGTVDLVAAENGGRLVRTSDAFYSSPAQLLLPGRARSMGEGWENARRRGGGNDFAVFALGVPGTVHHLELDTGWFVGNAPGAARVSVADARVADLDDDAAWAPVLERRALQPDTRHRFTAERLVEATHARLDVYPDGGLSRLRLWGELGAASLRAAHERWQALRP